VIGGQSGFWAAVTSNTMIYALLGLSLVVLTGWSGQVSLMPGTFAGANARIAAPTMQKMPNRLSMIFFEFRQMCIKCPPSL